MSLTVMGIMWGCTLEFLFSDWIFLRAACPVCLSEKSFDETKCAACGQVLETIVPEDVVYNGQLQQLH